MPSRLKKAFIIIFVSVWNISSVPLDKSCDKLSNQIVPRSSPAVSNLCNNTIFFALLAQKIILNDTEEDCWNMK